MAENTENGMHNTGFITDENITNIDAEEPDTFKVDFQMENKEISHKKHKKHHKTRSKFKEHAILSLKYLSHVVVGAYFGYATYHYVDTEYYKCYPGAIKPPTLCGIQFCNGYGFLVLLLGFIYFGLFYYLVLKPRFGRRIYKGYLKPFNTWWMEFSRTNLISAITILIVSAAFCLVLFFEAKHEPEKLIALIAPCFFIVTGYTFSTARRAIKWRTVITGITCQFILGLLCIRWEIGRKIFQCVGNKVATFLNYSDSGSRFVFGNTIVDDKVFAFGILSVIYFFSFFISILYFLGVMQWVVMKLGWILQQILGTTVCESVTASANIFLGMSESPLLIRPYIKILTASEIHAIMVSGFATVSGTTLAAYMSFGASPAHLITSSVMAAPATLALSKLFLPETEESKTTSDNIELEKSEDSSILDAASSGANNAIPIVLGIIANIVAFVAFISFLNGLVNWLGYLVGANEDFDFEWIFSKIFIPVVWAMGVPYRDCETVAKVVAKKLIINEFVAYERLGEYIKTQSIGARSAVIATYAICGFGNPSSLGILIGSLSAMAPKRRGLITAVAFRAVLVGTIVCFISASFAGILIQEEEEKLNYEKIFNAPERQNITLAFLQKS